jgi:hypothetical protein
VNRSPSRLAALLTTAILVATACESGSILPGNTPAAVPYSCGSLSGGHCYGEVSVDPSHVHGFRTQILVTSQLASGDGFIDNEFWLNPFEGTGWLEAGYDYHPVYGLTYFWAEDRQDGLFINHWIDYNRQDDGNYLTVDIHETTADNFSISLTGKGTSYAYSYPNFPLFGSSDGGWVMMGQELAGTSGASAPFVLYLFSSYYDSAGVTHFITGGSPSIGQPPYGGWLAAPSPGNQGGAWSTWCCAP